MADGRFVCANPNCAEDIRLTTITVTRHDLWQCGDHDERPLTKAFIVCSWECAAVMTRDLATEQPSKVETPF